MLIFHKNVCVYKYTINMQSIFYSECELNNI